MLFAFLISIIGFSIAHRISTHLLTQRLVDRNALTKIGTASFLMMLTLLISLPHAHLTFWFAIIASITAFVIMFLIVMKRRSALLSKRLRESVMLISLKMKAGRSFRQALAEVTAESDSFMQDKLSEIGSVVVFSQQNASFDPLIAEVVEEFLAIDRNPHSASRRLAVFREKLRIEDDFRRRSGQVLARIRAQSFVMSGLYVAVFAFMAAKFGFRDNSQLMIGSAFLFLIGGIWIWLGGRRLKWTV